MKRFRCGFLVLLIALIATLPASADKAKSFYSKGQQAEARQDYEQAYKYFKQAYDLHPEQTQYRSAFERSKFLAAAAHVHHGQVLRDQGKLDEAMKEFQLAAMVDSSSGIAQQEINRTQRLIDKARQPANGPPVSRANDGLSESAQSIAGPVLLAPISQTPLTLKLAEDSKTIYETIGKLAGINVLFDPDYTSRRIRIELNGVSLDQALRVVALQSHTFWRPVTPNTVYIAQDTQQKRNDVEQQVLRTFYLNNFSTVSELQDVANLIRTILRVERVQQFPAQNVIVMRGTPDQVALAELLISNLDKAKSEVVVDVVVMQVSKTKLKQLGIQYPFQGGSSNPSITFQSPSLTNSTTSSTTSTTGTTSTSSGLTLNSLANLNATDFAVSIPSSSVAFLMTDSDTNVIQRPQIRSVDGQKATLKIGERVPIAVGTSSSTLTATALTQTQFQYQDVGVNIEMTPHIHGNGDVSMKISIEVSAIDSYSTIGGLTEPIIGQRKIDHEIRMRDGEVNLIGGMMEHDDVQNMSGLPWLSQLPVLKYLFGQGQKSKTDNETVFALIPHVVRRLDIDDLNIRPVDIGTQNVVEVRHTMKAPAPVVPPPPTVPSAAPTPASTVPAAIPGGVQNPRMPQAASNNSAAVGGAPDPVSAAGVAASAAVPTTLGPVLSLDPPMVNQAAGSMFAVSVILNGGQNVFTVPVQVNYDPKVLTFVSVSNAGALSKDGAAVALVHRDDMEKGTLQVSLMRPPGSNGINPQGPLFTLMFVAKTAGQGTISIGKAVLRDPNMGAIEASGSQAIINVR
jgi:general secretion pathway protein D